MVVFFRWIIHLKKKTYSKKNYKHLQTASHIKQTNIKQTATKQASSLGQKQKKNRKKVARLLCGLCIHLWSGLGRPRYLVRLSSGNFPWVHRQTPGIHYMKCHLNMESISKRSTCHLPSIKCSMILDVLGRVFNQTIWV